MLFYPGSLLTIRGMEPNLDDWKIRIEDLYPDLSSDQLKEAEHNLNRYLELCLEIFKENEDKMERLEKMTE